MEQALGVFVLLVIVLGGAYLYRRKVLGRGGSSRGGIGDKTSRR